VFALRISVVFIPCDILLFLILVTLRNSTLHYRSLRCNAGVSDPVWFCPVVKNKICYRRGLLVKLQASVRMWRCKHEYRPRWVPALLYCVIALNKWLNLNSILWL